MGLLKAEQVIVSELLEDGTEQICAAIKLGDRLIFADNGDSIELPNEHIKIIERLSWIDISEAILGE